MVQLSGRNIFRVNTETVFLPDGPRTTTPNDRIDVQMTESMFRETRFWLTVATSR